MSASRILSLLVLGLLLSATLSPAQAQRTTGSVGLGGQVGEPSGLSLKFYNESSPSYDFLAAWSLVDDNFFLNAHGLWNYDIEAENVDQDLEWFVGPGGFLIVNDSGPGNNGEIVLGISGTIGLNFVVDRRFELFAQVTPRIAVVEETGGDVGGGVGFRYYF
ncbi:MAG: hypothetical protein ABEL97_14975 [Salinibacter sp.]